MDRCCEQCVNYATVDTEGGECRRFPPTYLAAPDDTTPLVFPLVPVDLWCGEFQRRVH